MASIDEHRLEAVLEHRPARLPIHAGGFHRDPRDVERFQPIPERKQIVNGGLELGDMLLKFAAVPDPHARGHARLVHVQRARAINDPVHHQPPEADIR